MEAYYHTCQVRMARRKALRPTVETVAQKGGSRVILRLSVSLSSIIMSSSSSSTEVPPREKHCDQLKQQRGDGGRRIPLLRPDRGCLSASSGACGRAVSPDAWRDARHVSQCFVKVPESFLLSRTGRFNESEILGAGQPRRKNALKHISNSPC